MTMTQKFTTPCFIRKNDPELRKKLEELGYKIINSGGTTLDAHNFDGRGHHKHIDEGTAIITSYGGYYGVVYVADDVTNKGRIDCGTNESLFLALAALREDNDYMQFFTNGEEFILCDKKSWLDGKIPDLIHKRDLSIAVVSMLYNYHKATVEEIIEHFNK